VNSSAACGSPARAWMHQAVRDSGHHSDAVPQRAWMHLDEARGTQKLELFLPSRVDAPLDSADHEDSDRIPTLGGDAPLLGVRTVELIVVPRALGCTRYQVGLFILDIGSPARAVMHRSASTSRIPAERFTRARLDAPLSSAQFLCGFLLLPRTRGCTEDDDDDDDDGYNADSPARAWMHLPDAEITAQPFRFPTARMDATRRLFVMAIAEIVSLEL
jgi:hypothetical protein